MNNNNINNNININDSTCKNTNTNKHPPSNTTHTPTNTMMSNVVTPTSNVVTLKSNRPKNDWWFQRKMNEDLARLNWNLYVTQQELELMIIRERTQFRILIHNRNPGDEFVFHKQNEFIASCDRLTREHQQKMIRLCDEYYSLYS
jgi:hypothetical protein